jgi:hypothetical protein
VCVFVVWVVSGFQLTHFALVVFLGFTGGLSPMLAVFILILVQCGKSGLLWMLEARLFHGPSLVPISRHNDMCKNSLAKELFRFKIFFFGFLVVE